MPKISIIILNYNSRDYLKKCLLSIQNNTYKNYEIIVVDNNSSDNSLALAPKIKSLITYKRKVNDGFSKGNNYGVTKTDPKSDYIFFLNPDTILEKDTLSQIAKVFDNNQKIDAITPKITLAKTNQIQPECHRGFPYPIRSLLHFLGITSKLYFQTNLDLDKTHPVEAGVGAALIIKKAVGDKIGWWDEDYFMYGEDLQICWDIKKAGFNLYFAPDIKLTHFQGISSGVKQHSKDKAMASEQTKIRSIKAGTNAMRIFHKKNLSQRYPAFVNSLIYFAINFLEKKRLSKLTT